MLGSRSPTLGSQWVGLLCRLRVQMRPICGLPGGAGMPFVFQDQMGPELGFAITSGGVDDRLFPWQGDASDWMARAEAVLCNCSCLGGVSGCTL